MLAAVVIAAALFGSPAPLAAAPSCASADINNDCAVTVADVQAAMLCALSAAPALACDVTADGAVNVVDAQAALVAIGPCNLVNACTICGLFGPELGGWVPVEQGWSFRAVSTGPGSATVWAVYPAAPTPAVTASLALSMQWPVMQTAAPPPASVPVWVALFDVSCSGGTCLALVCGSVVAGAVY